MKNIIRKLNMAMFVIGFTLGGFSSISSAGIINLNATEDTVVLDGDGTNYNYLGILGSELDTDGAGSVWMSVLKFDLSSLAGLSINSASFGLTSFSNHNSDPFAHDLFSSSDDSWAEGTVTGIDRPADSSLTFLSSTDINGVSQTYSWDILAGITGADGLGGTDDYLTLLLMPDLTQAGTAFGPHFYGRDSTTGFPVLIIDADAVVAVPEPTILFLLGLGLAGIGFSRKVKLVQHP